MTTIRGARRGRGRPPRRIPVGPDLARVVIADRDARADAGPDNSSSASVNLATQCSYSRTSCRTVARQTPVSAGRREAQNSAQLEFARTVGLGRDAPARGAALSSNRAKTVCVFPT